jgi:hypothetical protein
VTVTSLPVSDPARLLVAAVDALAEQDLAELPGPAALERTRVVLAELDRLRALALQGLSDVERRDLHELEGAATTATWVAAQGVAGVDRHEVALARRLATVPAVESELRAGAVSVAAACKVAAAMAKARPFLDRPDGLIDGLEGEQVLYGVLVDGVCDRLAEQTGGAPASDPEHARLRAELEAIVASGGSQRERLEAGLLLFAQRSMPALLGSGLAMLLDALLPAEHDKRAARAEDEAGVDLHRKPGGSGGYINGDLDDECYELLHTVIEAQRAVDPANPADTDAHRAASDQPELAGLEPEHWPDAVARPRSRRAQRHDALKAGLRALLDSGALGLRDKVAPHMSVTVSVDFLQGVPGALPATTAGGARWSRAQVRRLLCQSRFTRMVLDAGRRVVEMSHTERTLKPHERKILNLQWGGVCAAAHCARGPASGHPLIPHHIDLFSRTGTTSLAGTAPLCEQDHHDLHVRGRPITLKDGRVIGPDGHVQQKSA